nr:hypothetical protein [Tanacetum cinerariifolium]
MVEEDRDVINDNNSSDLTLSASLNDLDLLTLNIDDQSSKVDAPPDIINVDDNDDFIDDEDDVPYDFEDSNDEVFVDANDDQLSVAVARGHGVDDGGDDASRPPSV